MNNNGYTVCKISGYSVLMLTGFGGYVLSGRKTHTQYIRFFTGPIRGAVTRPPPDLSLGVKYVCKGGCVPPPKSAFTFCLKEQ